MLEGLFKSRHYEVWLLRKRGNQWMLIHRAITSMANDHYRWGDKIYTLKSEGFITYTTKLGANQRDILIFDADSQIPLHFFEPDVKSKLYKSALKIGIATSGEALRNFEKTEIQRRYQRAIMFLSAGLAVAIGVIVLFVLNALGFLTQVIPVKPAPPGTTRPFLDPLFDIIRRIV